MQNGTPKKNGCGWWCAWCSSWVAKENTTDIDPWGHVIPDTKYHDLQKGGCGEVVERRKRIS